MTESTRNPDRPASTRLPVIMGVVLALIVLAVVLVTVRQRARKPAGPPLPVLYGLTEFKLTNQLGAPFTIADLRGHVSVVNVIFTRCPVTCQVMSRQFAKLQQQLPADASVQLVTLTIDPEFDTPEVLTRYGGKLGADFSRWSFVTGALSELRRVAIDDFKFVALDKDADTRESKDDLFIHSTYFMVVDPRARVRAVIESAEPGALEKTLDAINRLRAEP